MAPTSPTNAGAPSLTLTMKLLVDAKAQRVLYAEARKDVVDFLFSFLALHFGSAVELLGHEAMVGSVSNLYASVEMLDATYVQPGVAKDSLLRPTSLSPAVGTKSSDLFRLPASTPAPSQADSHSPKKFFRCSNNSNGGRRHYNATCNNYVSETGDTTCPSCGWQMNTEVVVVLPPAAPPVEASSAGSRNNGFVQGVVTYTVMDDLKVAPMSTISGITLLNTLGITDIGMLREETVQLGYEEGLEVLGASLQSKTVLTDVFLGKKQKV